jgi:uncharacterized protein
MNKRSMLPIDKSDSGIVFKVRVQPKSAKNEIRGVMGDALGIKVTSLPIEGRANRACIDFLARELGVRKSHVEIIAGHKSRIKVVRVRGITPDEMERLVQRGEQKLDKPSH